MLRSVITRRSMTIHPPIAGVPLSKAGKNVEKLFSPDFKENADYALDKDRLPWVPARLQKRIQAQKHVRDRQLRLQQMVQEAEQNISDVIVTANDTQNQEPVASDIASRGDDQFTPLMSPNVVDDYKQRVELTRLKYKSEIQQILDKQQQLELNAQKQLKSLNEERSRTQKAEEQQQNENMLADAENRAVSLITDYMHRAVKARAEMDKRQMRAEMKVKQALSGLASVSGSFITNMDQLNEAIDKCLSAEPKPLMTPPLSKLTEAAETSSGRHWWIDSRTLKRVHENQLTTQRQKALVNAIENEP
ncbi:hypothetical protein MIR68_008210 [Amoeboaphelidium protococcarum]|nr:hypothetical protein MIR68_008210 [Amoeboaphelidium protococcarum]